MVEELARNIQGKLLYKADTVKEDILHGILNNGTAYLLFIPARETAGGCGSTAQREPGSGNK